MYASTNHLRFIRTASAILVMLLIVVLVACQASQPASVNGKPTDTAIVRYHSRHHPVHDASGMVASQIELASRVGAEILAAGGNAVDASVAVGFALAVTLPRAGNIGGGGFMLAYIAAEDKTVAIDYRETAPPRATADMFLDANGDIDPRLSKFSHLASGVPGTVAGLALAHENYGSLPWKTLLLPAILLARDGIVASHDLSQVLASRQNLYARTKRPVATSTRLTARLISPATGWCSRTWPIRYSRSPIREKRRFIAVKLPTRSSWTWRRTAV